MYKVKLAYTNADINFKNLILELFPDLEYYNEDIPKERRKAFSIKNLGATRLSPFLIIVNVNRIGNKVFTYLIKAFWQEDNTCTIKNITEWVNLTKDTFQ